MCDDGYDVEVVSVNVRLFRLAHGLSVEDIAHHVGCDASRVVAIEDGTALPTMAQMEQLSIVLNVGPDTLLYRGPIL